VGQPSAGREANQTLRSMANNVFTGINEAGDIG
jgi:hypothetical protein